MFLTGKMRRRDGLLILIGASLIYICSSLLYNTTFLPSLVPGSDEIPPPETWQKSHRVKPAVLSPPASHQKVEKTEPKPIIDLGISRSVPETSLVAHAPGWTLYRNLYMSNGTLYIVSSKSHQAVFPEIRMMTSTGLLAENTPENIAAREPTDQEMQIITPEAAMKKWGANWEENERNRIRSIEGFTLLVNEPWQFLNHYYHFVAELLFGTWAFLYGVFNPNANFVKPDEAALWSMNATVPSFNLPHNGYLPPSLTRIIFMHATTEGWKDKPGFNSYFLRAAFPSLTVETSSDWEDRINATAVQTRQRAWHLPLVLLSDRSAAFRGEACGARTQRIAAEAWEVMVRKRGIDVVGRWWNVLREAVMKYAGVKVPKDDGVPLSSEHNDVADPQILLPLPKDIVITYINRQGVRRHLIQEDHDALVSALEQLVKRKKIEEGKEWVLRVVQPELLSKEEQIQLASETTIMLGVHGNGLTHLVFMKPNRYSSVIEIFYPDGFAHDYEWTARALGMRHFSIWNDTTFTYPNEPPWAAYPEGFQGTSIPVHGETVAKLIEDRLEGRLQF